MNSNLRNLVGNSIAILWFIVAAVSGVSIFYRMAESNPKIGAATFPLVILMIVGLIWGGNQIIRLLFVTENEAADGKDDREEQHVVVMRFDQLDATDIAREDFSSTTENLIVYLDNLERDCVDQLDLIDPDMFVEKASNSLSFVKSDEHVISNEQKSFSSHAEVA